MEIPHNIIDALIGSIIAIIAWLIKNQVGQIKADMHEMRGELNAFGTSVADLRESRVEQRLRLAAAESRLDRVETKYEHLAGFLHAKGFRRSDGGIHD